MDNRWQRQSVAFLLTACHPDIIKQNEKCLYHRRLVPHIYDLLAKYNKEANSKWNNIILCMLKRHLKGSYSKYLLLMILQIINTNVCKKVFFFWIFKIFAC